MGILVEHTDIVLEHHGKNDEGEGLDSIANEHRLLPDTKLELVRLQVSKVQLLVEPILLLYIIFNIERRPVQDSKASGSFQWVPRNVNVAVPKSLHDPIYLWGAQNSVEVVLCDVPE